jgi:hypothetical protein
MAGGRGGRRTPAPTKEKGRRGERIKFERKSLKQDSPALTVTPFCQIVNKKHMNPKSIF